jgi:predicted cobalt transporter CbtA
VTFKWPSKKRIPWLLGALVLMFVSAYSIFTYYAIGANVGDRIGFPQFAAQIPKLEAEGLWWGRLGIALPFLAALLLGFGKEEVVRASGRVELPGPGSAAYSAAEPHEWFAPIGGYLFRLAVSVVGTLGFAVLLLLVLFAFYKLGIHVG